MRAWNGSREPLIATSSRVKGWGSLRAAGGEVATCCRRGPWPRMLSITSSRAWGRLQGRRDAYCTRPPQLCRAPTMSWLMSSEHLAGVLSGFSRKILASSLENSFTHQKRMSRFGRGQLAVLDELGDRARPISRTLPQPLPSSLADVISSWMWAVRTICWSGTVRAPDPSLDHGLLATAREKPASTCPP